VEQDWLASTFGLTDRVALVTGGGSGLGRAMATALARAGADVAVLDIDLRGAEETAVALRQVGARAVALHADVTQRGAVQDAQQAVLAAYGHVDELVNSAGVTHTTWATEMDDATWERVLRVNLAGTFLCCQIVGRHMVERRQGSIVNIASIAGFSGIRQKVAYNASKGGVVQVTRTLAVEWAPYNVRVNAIAPTSFDTPLVRQGTQAAAPDLLRDLLRLTPIGRKGQPEEIMGAVVFLASPASSMVTGHVLAVDGGYLAQ
jgi:NAD(P)-dependent dehydrogenase (short-subunit alcohol dehydrogenase family)